MVVLCSYYETVLSFCLTLFVQGTSSSAFQTNEDNFEVNLYLKDGSDTLPLAVTLDDASVMRQVVGVGDTLLIRGTGKLHRLSNCSFSHWQLTENPIFLIIM